jgi:acyl-CoA dehydrogenase
MADLQMVQGHVADMALDVDASALLIYRAAWTKDTGAARVTREAAMAKLHATETAQAVIDKAVQLHGGDGVRPATSSKACTARSARCASTRVRRTCRRW